MPSQRALAAVSLASLARHPIPIGPHCRCHWTPDKKAQRGEKDQDKEEKKDIKEMIELSKISEPSWLRGLTQRVCPWKGNETSRSRARVQRIWGSSKPTGGRTSSNPGSDEIYDACMGIYLVLKMWTSESARYSVRLCENGLALLILVLECSFGSIC